MKTGTRYGTTVTLAILTAVSLVLSFFALTDQIEMSKEPLKIESINAESFKEKEIVTDWNYAVMDCYGETYREGDDGRKEDLVNYYLIPVGEVEYATIMVSGAENIANYDALMADTQKVIMGEADEITASPIWIDGKITKIDSEMKEYLYQWCEETNYFGTDDRTEIDKFVLSDYAISPLNRTKNLMLLATFIGLFVLLGAATVISFFITRNKIKKEEMLAGANMPQGGAFYPTENVPAQQFTSEPQPQQMPEFQPDSSNTAAQTEETKTLLDGEEIDN
ncbi:MAG: DUF6709 family protein [Oscillospiraceae bacterium]